MGFLPLAFFLHVRVEGPCSFLFQASPHRRPHGPRGMKNGTGTPLSAGTADRKNLKLVSGRGRVQSSQGGGTLNWAAWALSPAKGNRSPPTAPRLPFLQKKKSLTLPEAREPDKSLGLLPALALSGHSPADLGGVARLDHAGNCLRVLCFPLVMQQCLAGTISKFNSNFCFTGDLEKGGQEGELGLMHLSFAHLEAPLRTP